MPAFTRQDASDLSLFTTWINSTKVPTLESKFMLYRLGVPQVIPPGSGDTVQVQFADNLPATSTPVDELATGVANQVSYTRATMRIRYHANDVQMSQLADAINEVDYRGGALGRLTYNGAQVADLVARDALEGMTTNVRFANAAASQAAMVAGDTLTMLDLNAITTTLNVADVDPHPLTPGAYCGVIHPRNAGDLRGQEPATSNATSLLSWFDFVKRQDASAFENASVARTLGIEIKQSTHIRRFLGGSGGAVALYNGFVAGDHLLMVGAISGLPGVAPGERGGAPSINVIPPTPSHFAPYGNLWVLSFAYYTAGGLIDDTRGSLLTMASAA